MNLALLKKFYLLYTKGTVGYARKIGVTVGENCRLFTSKFGSEPFLIKIGNKVTITSGVKFINHDGSTWLMRDEKGRRYLYQRIDIGNNVFIGVNSIIMPGVKIEDNVIVAAGSVITKSIPSGVIVAGVPAKIIGSYSEIEKRMLDLYVSDKDLNNKLNYEERVNSVLTSEFKPFLKNQ